MSTNEIILLIIFIAIGALTGFIFALLLKARKQAQLEEQLKLLRTSVDEGKDKEQHLSQALQEAQDKNQTQAYELISLKERANASNQQHTQQLASIEQLTHQLHESKQALSDTQENWVSADKQNESLRSDNTNLQRHINDLKSRLDESKQDQITLNNTINDLKNKLADEGKELRAAQSENASIKEQVTSLTSQQQAQNKAYESLLSKHQALNNTYTQLSTELTEREASHHREVDNFEKQKASLSEQFKVLSQQILEEKSRALQANSQQSLQSVISPFAQSIDQFKKEVQDIHHRETTQRSELKKELETLKDLNLQITTEAHELSTALKGQKKLQGNWGELVLENVLDRAGLQPGVDYKREMSITTEEGRQRPDAVVFLPQQKHLIIDAKVSLNAYTRYVNAENDITRKNAIAEHIKAMRDRINELADRDYYKLPGLNSPAMVFMFVPIESAFVEALKADETLFQKAIENNVLVATPTTLLTSLNIVKQLWRFEDQNKHTATLAKKAEGVFKKLNTFLGSFENIRKGLTTATDAYTKAENQLVSGKGNLVKQVGEFKNLAPAIKGQLPSHFEEKAALEIDFEQKEDDTGNNIDNDKNNNSDNTTKE